MVEGGEVEIFLGEVEVGEENGKKRKERRRKKEKGKEIGIREDISLERENENNWSGGFPGFSCGRGNLSEKYRNRPKFKCLGTTRKLYQKSII